MLTRITAAVTIVSALAFGGMVLAQDKPLPVSLLFSGSQQGNDVMLS